MIVDIIFYFSILATATTTGETPLDFTVTSSNTYRPLTYTEKVFTDEWAKKLPTNNHRKGPLTTNQQQGLFNLSL